MLPRTTLSSKLVHVVVVLSLVKTMSGWAVEGSSANHATVGNKQTTFNFGTCS